MNTDSKIGPFRLPKDSQMITRHDVEHWIAEQARHSREVDSGALHHQCDFCPVRIALPPLTNDVQRLLES